MREKVIIKYRRGILNVKYQIGRRIDSRVEIPPQIINFPTCSYKSPVPELIHKLKELQLTK